MGKSMPDEQAPLVLVVEDNDFNRVLVEAILGDAFRVAGAGSAEEARQLLEGIEPDLILMDMRLPGMQGLDFTRELKGRRHLGTPIVALTANATENDRQAALEAGCADFITKPVDTRTLNERLGAILARRAVS